MKKAKTKKSKKGAWFVAVRGSYLPYSWQAWVMYVPFVVFLVTVLVAAVRNEHSASGVFYVVFPQWVCAAVVMTWIANKKS